MNAGKIIYNLRRTTNGKILLHLALWVFYFLAILYLGSISFNNNKSIAFVLTPLRYTVGTVLIFYPLMYWIWPNFFMKKKYFAGAALIILLIILYATIDYTFEYLIFSNCPPCMNEIKAEQHGYYELINRGPFNVIILRLITLGIVYQLFVFLAFPVGIKVFFEYLNQRLDTLRLQRENIQLEFNFLKAQVNPHFLFNTLNNIYALILKDKKNESAETVARLSTFMRYTLYESDSHSNNVVKEIDLLKAYISLEQIRLNDIVVNFVTTIDKEDHNLPPLLFMPVVENAFKYCTRNRQNEAYLFIRFDIENSKLAFRISNTYDEEKRAQSSPRSRGGGIGLDNLRKRLKYYYPENNSNITISDSEGIYMVTVQLNLMQL